MCILNLFGELAYPQLDVRAIIGREKMRESRFYREVIEEGKVLARREALLETLQERFGTAVRDELEPAVNAIEDTAELSHLQRLAVGCSRLEEFRAALPGS